MYFFPFPPASQNVNIEDTKAENPPKKLLLNICFHLLLFGAMQQIVLTHLVALSGLKHHCKLKFYNSRFRVIDQKIFWCHIVQQKGKFCVH